MIPTKTSRVLLTTLFAVCASPLGDVWAQHDPKPILASEQRSETGVTSSQVFARINQLSRKLDILLEWRELDRPVNPVVGEFGLSPVHVYQLMLTNVSRAQELGDRSGVLHLPTLVASPRNYTSRDVLFLTDMVIDHVDRIATSLGAHDLPHLDIIVSKKTPTQVFNQCINVLGQLNALCDKQQISASEVYAEMVRADADVRSILEQSDPFCRYRINAPQTEPERTPSDVLIKCFDIRRAINHLRAGLGMPRIAVPTLAASAPITPMTPFVQTQIIIAELNALKVRMGTISSTPLAIPVASKTPTDVHAEAGLIEYLLTQVTTGSPVTRTADNR
jgi:hypothetical protein